MSDELKKCKYCGSDEYYWLKLLYDRGSNKLFVVECAGYCHNFYPLKLEHYATQQEINERSFALWNKEN